MENFNESHWIIQIQQSVFPNLFVVTFMVYTDYVVTHLQAETDLEWLTRFDDRPECPLVDFLQPANQMPVFSLNKNDLPASSWAHVQFYLLEMLFFSFHEKMQRREPEFLVTDK